MSSRVGMTEPPGIILFDVKSSATEIVNTISQPHIIDYTDTVPTTHQKTPVSPDRHAIIPTAVLTTVINDHLAPCSLCKTGSQELVIESTCMLGTKLKIQCINCEKEKRSLIESIRRLKNNKNCVIEANTKNSTSTKI